MAWVKNNKLAVALILVLLFLLLKDNFFTFLNRQGAVNYSSAVPAPEMAVGSALKTGISSGTSSYGRDYAPTEQKDRLVVEESSLSLVVTRVKETTDKIVDQAKEIGGFMVSSSLSQPEEAPFATIVVRIPSEKLRETLESYRQLAIKVSSENILGTDVTSEYVDIEARLETLGATKAKFEEILAKATQVQDILIVQRELITLQDQIDSLKGRQKYLEQTAHLAKVTLYLSSDEMALPYAPTTVFRPEVILKLAIRSLVGALRSLATVLIWVVVYSVIWGPSLIIVYLVLRWRKRKVK